MKIYTKILIGMAVGVVVGVTLGPRSVFLAQDSYLIADLSQLALFLDRDVEESRIQLPVANPTANSRRGSAVRFEILDTQTTLQSDLRSVEHQVPTWSLVRFRWSKQMAMRDGEGAINQRLGRPAVGGWVEVWLRIESIHLENGGFASSPVAVSGLGSTIIGWLSPVGMLFMRLIMMVIVPLVFASLLVGVASLGDVRRLGRLGGRTLLLYLGTTAAAVSIGLACANLCKPGHFMDESSRARLQAEYHGAAGDKLAQAADVPPMIDTILSIVPENPVAALAAGNMLQIMFFALIFGIALTLLPDSRSAPVVEFFDRVQQAMVVVINMVMAVAPYGVAALIAEVVGTSGLGVLGSLLVYGLTVLSGLAVHTVFVYGGLLRFGARLKIFPFLRAARPAQLIAFSTSSSSAALPVTMECAQKNLGVSRTVSSFVLPLGSTVNMDGTALYQGVAAVFVAQVFQIDLSLTAQITIVLTATMASIGAAGVPGAGMVTLALVLTTVGIPPAGVALILGLDRILDMFRTVVNVTGDLTVTSVMAHAEGEILKR